MSSLSRNRTSQGDRVPEGTQADQSLTTMDTQTKVTNSPLASGNPTPAPCAQCTNAQATSTTLQLAHFAQQGHVLVSATRPTHALVHGPGLSTVLEAYPHKHGALVPHPGLLGTSSIRAVQTLPRSSEQSLNQKYRPILVTGNPTAFGRIASMHDAQTVQMLAHTSQAGGNSSQSQAQQQTQQASAVVKPSATPSSGNVVVAGLVAPDGSTVGASSAARIAQLLTPSGLTPGMVNAPVMLYYPQTAIPSGKPTVSANEEFSQGSQSSAQHQHQQQQQQQQPTVYYAVATSDLLRQLQASQSSSHDSNPRPQLIQTPSGLVLVQQQTTTQTSQPQSQSSVPQLQQHHTLSQIPMHASLTNSLKLPVSQVVSSLSSNVVESATLPRQSRNESIPQQTGLICTCPPEVHQALFEQQRRQKQQQQQQQQQQHITRTASQDRQPPAQQQSWPSKAGTNIAEPSAEHRSVNQGQTKQIENGCISRSSQEGQTNAQTTIIASPCCAAAQVEQKRVVDSAELSNEERAEKEAHVNYLVTLFQALRASGVQPDSFLVALQRTELPIPTTESTNKHRYAILAQNKAQLDECRRTLATMRQLHKQFKQKITEDLQHCRDSFTHVIHQYQNRLFYPTDPSLQAVRLDRVNLDRMMVELNDSKSSLTEQLHDLECVIEQTGNDVLQHRCRITVPYVQTLDSRLDSINRAVSSTCALYPDMKQRIANQEEAEIRAIDVEKKLLDEHLHQLEDIGEKCKRIKGTIMTLRRLAIVNVQNRQQASSPRRFAHLGGVLNRAAADPQSLERTRLYMSVKAIQPDSDKRMRAIQQQEILAKQRKRVLALESNREANALFDSLATSKAICSSDNVRKLLNAVKTQQPAVNIPTAAASVPTTSAELKPKVLNGTMSTGSGSEAPTVIKEEKKAPLAVYSDDSLSSTTTNGSNSTHEPWSLDASKAPRFSTSFNPSSVVSMIDETSDSTLENQPAPLPTGILKSIVQSNGGVKSPKQPHRPAARGSRAVMFNTTVTVDDGSEVLRLNCTLDESELGKNRVAPTEKQVHPVPISSSVEKSARVRITPERTIPSKALTKLTTGATRSVPTSTASTNRSSPDTVHETRSRSPNLPTSDEVVTSVVDQLSRDSRSGDGTNAAPAPPPRRSSQISSAGSEQENAALRPPNSKKKMEYENLDALQSPSSTKKMVPLTIPADMNASLVAPNE